ncbi:hypothetical protein GCM10029992_45330 [Glycomyces albus]
MTAQALGLIEDGPEARRASARASARPRRHEPVASGRLWNDAARRLADFTQTDQAARLAVGKSN